MFRNAVDVSNRALDHCGADPIDETLGFAEVSKNSRYCARIYDKLRRAELRRNVWRFAIRKAILRAIDTNTMALVAGLWASTTTYFVGSIVTGSNGQLWISRAPNNLAFQPESSPQYWEQYFGPMTVPLWVSTISYSAGELVYTTAGDGRARIYLSLQSANEDTPATATAWDATSVYSKNQVVTYLSVAYMSRIDLNTAQTPTASAADWDIAVTYGAAAAVTGSDGLRYTSIAGANLANDPVISPLLWTNTNILTPWTTVFTGGAGSLKWLQIGGTEFPMGVGLTTMNIVYPLGSGPVTQSITRNVFRLPSSYLRQAPRDPKAGATSYLGAAWGLDYDDWLFEGNYIVSSQVDPIFLRFVADVADVTAMDDMFCEGLAASMALAVVQPLTQSGDKLKTIASVYTLKMGEARTINSIETGSEEPPVDSYISCRA